MAETEEAPKKGMDPLKAYCLVLGLLCLVLGYLWFRIRTERVDYEAATDRAERLLTGKGMVRMVDDRPTTLPDLAYEVEQYVETKRGMAEEGDATSGIPLETMTTVARTVNMVQESAGTERKDVNENAGYVTTSREFDYKTPANLQQLLRLVWYVETRGPYRVNELRWQLADVKDNSSPPFNNITKPRIKVSVRTPIQKRK